MAKQQGCQTILNPTPVVDLPDSIWEHVDIITPNQTEAFMLTGVEVTDSNSAQESCQILRSKGIETAIITMGEQGVYVQNSATDEMVKAFKAGSVVDTTGAGDAFNGALAKSLSYGEPLIQAVRYGCAIAALSVTKMGAGNGMPYQEDIEHFLTQQQESGS